MAQHNEIEFEKEFAEYLPAHGWLYSPNDDGYDRERALFPEDVLGWLADTQPEQLEKVVKARSGDVAKQQAQLLDRLVKVLDTPMDNGGGTLNLLRKGFSHLAAKIQMCVFKPESTLNEKRNADYAAVRVRVMRQVHFSTADQRSVDLVFFVNGLPVATAELKTYFTQTIADAINQYKNSRLPKDPGTGAVQPLFVSGARALVHFAVSNDEVWMTTKLAGGTTHFLPFNRGTEDGGAGNPLNPTGSKSAYLWQRVLERDAWLNILGRLMYIKHESITDPISGKTSKSSSLRFPRFHQWEAVTELTAAVTAEGVGKRYLIQHSAGSGKTDSIAWTAHRMARMHVDNQKVFDSVIVVTDRNVLDAQLQDAVKQIDNDQGIVVAIDRDEAAKAGGESRSKSGLLANALIDGKLIIVVTIQTFPFAMNEIRKNKGLKGKTFAVIADEAHSSQSGQIAGKLKSVLTAEELKDIADGGEIDVEAVLAAEATERAESANISYFAFTATPKAKTLELFGRKPTPDESPVPFHVYTMKQAIEEGYILDVLTGYHSFKLAFQIGQNASHENEVDQAQATKEVMHWVKLNPQTITQKAAIIVEHFHENVAGLLDGHAKAMVVTDSRKAAVRYKLAIDAFIAKKGYGYGTLVAFSGTVQDPESGPGDFTESSMNPGVHDLRTSFRGDHYKVMIVANKFQTGFDQPLLCAMYADRILSGVTAVQTLSRLNRTYRTPSGIQKTAAMTQVVDFVNEPEEIRKAFEPYFTDAFLETETDPNLVHDLAAKLDTTGIYTQAEIDQCAEAFVTGKGNNALAAAIDPGKKRFAERYQAALIDNGGEGDRAALAELDMFRKDVGSFVRLYDFMSQIIDYGDPSLEKKQIYLRNLERVIQPDNYTAPIDLSDVVLKQVKQIDRGKIDISLGVRVGLSGITAAGSGEKRDPKMVAFQQVLDRLNDLFGSADFTESQKVSFLESLLRTLLANESLVQQAKVNSAKQFVESPDFDDAVTGAVADNHGAHEKMSDYFFTNAPGRSRLISDIAKWFYQVVSSQ
ncbi:type I restriction endonuclease subunit R [Mycobacterium arosiense]|uniref:Restriction endonuclease subunit R n=1 Tax=Mycobacterium arosiense ATCC BAA-1401 = DSM 45069 TaxID=1265311 RepID=A0A1W9Z8A2_MYCAI|nr:type I restriction endonuclease [Mycobacterium arosiense]ORA08500.1 restriction endonuclease subunit R [Mycobacterium arosiense ATCC BAA-1401 = DSM 45069]